MHYNGRNSYVFVNGVEICKLKAKDLKRFGALLCLDNVSKDFSVDYDSIDVDDILDINKHY